MSTESVADRSAATVSSAAPSRAAYVTTLVFISVVLVLHGPKPEIDPAWRFISEYALGANGWLMNLAFIVFSLAHMALVVGLNRWLRGTWPGRVAQALLVVSGAGLAVAGAFTTDSILAPRGDSTLSGQLHNVGGAMGMAMPIAVAAVTWRLLKDATWAGARRLLIGSASLALMGAVVSAVALGVLLSNNGGTFGPGVPVGGRIVSNWPRTASGSLLSRGRRSARPSGDGDDGEKEGRGARRNRCVPRQATGDRPTCARGAAANYSGGCAGRGGVDQEPRGYPGSSPATARADTP